MLSVNTTVARRLQHKPVIVTPCRCDHIESDRFTVFYHLLPVLADKIVEAGVRDQRRFYFQTGPLCRTGRGLPQDLENLIVTVGNPDYFRKIRLSELEARPSHGLLIRQCL